MKFPAKKWAWTALLFLGSMLLASLKIVVLPQGGAITYFSLLLLWLITFFYGFRHGLLVSTLYGFARLLITYLTGEYINYHPIALLLEYPLAHGVFCLGGLLKEPDKYEKIEMYGGYILSEPYRLRMGYLIGVLGQCVFYVISAVLFYPPDREGFFQNLLFCIAYDGSYLLVEGLFTLILISLPSVAQSIYYLKYIATHEEADDTLEHF